MFAVRQQVDLRAYNSLGITERAEHLVEIHSDRELVAALDMAAEHAWPVTVLGGGSNVVVTGSLPGVVIIMRSRGRRVLRRAPDALLIEGEAGENWHDLVNWTLDLGLCGLENLSLIPGTLGAAPVQNIGAYGVELQDVFHSLDALDRVTGEIRQFDRAACHFGYRESVFKQSPGRYVILRVRLILRRHAQVRVDYAPLDTAWEATGLHRPDPRVVASLVCHIRQSKLPDPAVLGNAGSFFKNPLVTRHQLNALKALYPDIPHYLQPDGRYKVAAGWLIDQAGWKGVRAGHVGVHARQALVLVNHGGARGEDILSLAKRISDDVHARFGLELEMEPQRLG
ncbi:UDP-N-acetylenolpyruvoylglucosamine reductase [Halopseudomonas salina]|uniref:UDP-N-acetylenolpyruvoylglucosamine reductase n=2 Tax=Halopseudomonas salina TaxID=1323744 RepID=A0ABQ1PUK4_9GAMM|nr:UDP-N-acetylenolpyruvoylglucosamine reductase [Halopseudomonas salina]